MFLSPLFACVFS